MTPMLATLEVVGTLLWLLICILANRWYLWALLAVVVILDVVSARKKDREKEKRDAAATEALIREFRLDRSAPPANNSQTITNDQKPPEPPKMKTRLPDQTAGQVRRRAWLDVAFQIVRAEIPHTKVGEPVELIPDGDSFEVVQDGRTLGRIRDTETGALEDLRACVERGEMFLAALASVPFQGSVGKIEIAIYADPLEKYREKKNAFSAHLSAVSGAVPDILTGEECDVSWDDSRHRYDLCVWDFRVGSLPASVLDRLRAGDREPEDARFFVESVGRDPESGKTTCTVLVV